MSQYSALDVSLKQAMANRAKEGLTVFRLDKPLPSSAPDFFSNNYLSLSSDPSVRDIFLRKVQSAPPARLLGSTGSRLSTGSSNESVALEAAFTKFFGEQSALFFASGFNANFSFVSSVPQKNDVIIHDEFVHSSFREGIRLSSHTAYRFSHNSVSSFKSCLLDVLQKHPQIAKGSATVFILVESLYSMDGDFSPLKEIVTLLDTFVPAGHAHIVVDEAHTSGICGPNGTGYIAHLGLTDRVHTKIHTFGEAWGFHGAVVLTSPVVRDYMLNFAKNVMFSAAMPYTDIYAIESSLAVISGPRGNELRRALGRLCHYARTKFTTTLGHVPESILMVGRVDPTAVEHDLTSPIVPVFTPHAASLAGYLLQRGYAVSALTYPVVKRPRIRVIIHATNTEGQIDTFAGLLLAWAEEHERGESTENGNDAGAVVRQSNVGKSKL